MKKFYYLSIYFFVFPILSSSSCENKEKKYSETSEQTPSKNPSGEKYKKESFYNLKNVFTNLKNYVDEGKGSEIYKLLEPIISSLKNILNLAFENESHTILRSDLKKTHLIKPIQGARKELENKRIITPNSINYFFLPPDSPLYKAYYLIDNDYSPYSKRTPSIWEVPRFIKLFKGKPEEIDDEAKSCLGVLERASKNLLSEFIRKIAEDTVTAFNTTISANEIYKQERDPKWSFRNTDFSSIDLHPIIESFKIAASSIKKGHEIMGTLKFTDSIKKTRAFDDYKSTSLEAFNASEKFLNHKFSFTEEEKRYDFLRILEPDGYRNLLLFHATKMAINFKSLEKYLLETYLKIVSDTLYELES